ncbi:hypothetical protein CAPTEDRAFT_194361 [Capitella teleta]|uniref:G-protein coupled receptors family 1 profile domain-containing protein n=1 Tax=Capitella teleta TaxID=283909 RepID=R7UXT9_CAPTE|nr:hypothetical protein CAPTEDRAFT_194361 [Capitella teleta]|eukprot:ELU11393.1 hypothetical protein CAPTEDRAFT_194361 [Capitella teleta]
MVKYIPLAPQIEVQILEIPISDVDRKFQLSHREDDNKNAFVAFVTHSAMEMSTNSTSIFLSGLIAWYILTFSGMLLGISGNVYAMFRLMKKFKRLRPHVLLISLLVSNTVVFLLSVPLNMICVTFDLKDTGNNSTACQVELFQVAQAIRILSEIVFYIGVSFLAVHRLRIICSSLIRKTQWCSQFSFSLAGILSSWSTGILFLIITLSFPNALEGNFIPGSLIIVYFSSLIMFIFSYGKVLLYVYRADRKKPDGAQYRMNYQRFFEMTRTLRQSIAQARRQTHQVRGFSVCSIMGNELLSPSVEHAPQANITSALAPALVGAGLDPLNYLFGEPSQQEKHIIRHISRKQSSINEPRKISMKEQRRPSTIAEGNFSLPGSVEGSVHMLDMSPDRFRRRQTQTVPNDLKVGYYLSEMNQSEHVNNSFLHWVQQSAPHNTKPRSTTLPGHHIHESLRIPTWHHPKMSVMSRRSELSTVSSVSSITLPVQSETLDYLNSECSIINKPICLAYSANEFIPTDIRQVLRERCMSTKSLPSENEIDEAPILKKVRLSRTGQNKVAPMQDKQSPQLTHLVIHKEGQEEVSIEEQDVLRVEVPVIENDILKEEDLQLSKPQNLINDGPVEVSIEEGEDHALESPSAHSTLNHVPTSRMMPDESFNYPTSTASPRRHSIISIKLPHFCDSEDDEQKASQHKVPMSIPLSEVIITNEGRGCEILPVISETREMPQTGHTVIAGRRGKFIVTLKKTLLLFAHFFVLLLPLTIVRTLKMTTPHQDNLDLVILVTESLASFSFALFPFLYIFHNRSLMHSNLKS